VCSRAHRLAARDLFDEVQIDGGDTEALVAGNMKNPGKRLIVLSEPRDFAIDGVKLLA
jgi:hypothetical protein